MPVFCILSSESDEALDARAVSKPKIRVRARDHIRAHMLDLERWPQLLEFAFTVQNDGIGAPNCGPFQSLNEIAFTPLNSILRMPRVQRYPGLPADPLDRPHVCWP